jgi:glutamyl-tRNA reductase
MSDNSTPIQVFGTLFMSLFVLGINHKTAPVDIRERVSFAPEQLEQALGEIRALKPVEEAAILSTCNRTELYFSLQDDKIDEIIQWLGEHHKISPSDLEHYIYNHPDKEAVRHVLRVASGLDSLILGEPQILGQLKDAWRAADKAGSMGQHLKRLFQHSFTVAKQVRTDTAIGASPVSVAFAAVSLARQIFDELDEQTALLIGAGETIELAARHLHDNGIGQIIVANRTVERARKLAAQLDGYAISLDEIPAHIAEADIVISSTASKEPIVFRKDVESALKKRKHRPIFMVDIAVPRDIEASTSELDDIYLYTVDDLHGVIEENLKSRQEAARQAEEIIDVQVEHFLGWMQSLNAVDTIRAIRGQAEHQRDQVMAKAQRMLADNKPADEVMRFVANTLTNKLIHEPSANLKQAGYLGRDEIISAARELYNINDKKD